MPTITLKDIPTALHRDLKNRARTNHRSLNKEVLATLQDATTRMHVDAAALTQEARRLRKKFTREVTAQEIDSWKKLGRL